MENQHRKINGYRELTQEEIDLMNEVKAFGPQIESLINKINIFNGKLSEQLDKESRSGGEGAEVAAEQLKALFKATPARWSSIAATDIQKGLMALTRAVAKPTFF